MPEPTAPAALPADLPAQLPTDAALAAALADCLAGADRWLSLLADSWEGLG